MCIIVPVVQSEKISINYENVNKTYLGALIQFLKILHELERRFRLINSLSLAGFCPVHFIDKPCCRGAEHHLLYLQTDTYVQCFPKSVWYMSCDLSIIIVPIYNCAYIYK